MRWTTWAAEVSEPSEPSAWGTPALRKYLETTMSVASCDHSRGTSALSTLNTMVPSGSLMTDFRVVHSTPA